MALGLLANPVWSGGGGTLEGKAMEGKAIYVEGGRGWEFEGGFYQEQPRWLGEEATRMMRRNAEAVNQVSSFSLPLPIPYPPLLCFLWFWALELGEGRRGGLKGGRTPAE